MRPTKDGRLPQLRVEGSLKRELERMARKERKAVADLQREALDMLILDRRAKRDQAASVGAIERALGVANEELPTGRLAQSRAPSTGGEVDHG